LPIKNYPGIDDNILIIFPTKKISEKGSLLFKMLLVFADNWIIKKRQIFAEDSDHNIDPGIRSHDHKGISQIFSRLLRWLG
jgi:hypothetical protein